MVLIVNMLTTWCCAVAPCSSQHLDRMLPVAAYFTPFFLGFVLITKFNIKFVAVASELLDKGSLHVLVVIIADALQVFFRFFCCRPPGDHIF